MIVVERHGGRASDKWRVVWQGNDGEDADAEFRRWVHAMRQGGVRIRDDVTDRIVREQSAPRLRTRW